MKPVAQMPRPGGYSLARIEEDEVLRAEALSRGARGPNGEVIFRPSKWKWTKFKLTQAADLFKGSGNCGNATMGLGSAVVPIPVVGHIAGPVLFGVGGVISAGAGLCKWLVNKARF